MSRVRAFLDHLTNEQLVDRLDLALEGAGLGIWDWDLRDNSVHFDRRWCEMLGLDHQQTPMHLETWQSRVHPDDLAQCYVDITAHLEGRTQRYENVHRMRHADGRWVSILDRGRISGRDEAGKPIRFTGTHFDVTAQEEARRVLAGHQEMLAQLVANIPVGVLLLDPEGIVLALNPKWPLPDGFSVEGAVGRSIRDVSRPLSPWLEHLPTILRGQPYAFDEVPGHDYADQWVRWRAEPWTQPGSGVTGVQLMYEDITPAVHQRRREAKAHEAHIAGLSVFAGGVAHELNTPLQVILVEAEMLQEALDSAPLSDEGKEGIRSLRTTALHASAITRALRTLSRDARNDPTEDVLVAQWFEQATILVESTAITKNIDLQCAPPPEDLTVRGRPSELLHLLLTLIQHSIAASEGLPQATVWVHAEPRDGSSVNIVCRHQGTPIPSHLWEQLLQPGFNNGGPAEQQLSIAAHLATHNNGELSIRDTAAGTEFQLRLSIRETL